MLGLLNRIQSPSPSEIQFALCLLEGIKVTLVSRNQLRVKLDQLVDV